MSIVLIVDDEKALRDGLAEAIRDLGYEPVTASSGREALTEVVRTTPDAVLLDLRLPDMDGLQVLKYLHSAAGGAKPPVAIITAYATAANTIEAMRLGAFDHLTKPIGRDDLASVLERMLRSRAPKPPRPAAPYAECVPEDLIGSSASMREVQKTIGLVADSDATVLITGETGTGKEVVARTIHRVGARSAGAFMALNCAAIPSDLLESELFGHVKGAFTGAALERKGAFREAHGGTLFLDEIGDMDLAMQAKILRAIQERVVTPVGGRPQKIDVRIIAATHRELEQWVKQGRFREDLFYRLNVVPIALQPLRKRPSDIAALAEHFLALASSPKKHLSSDALQRLTDHAWPGNVRELRNAMERVAVLSRSDVLTRPDFDFLAVAPGTGDTASNPVSSDLSSALEQLERRMIADALVESKGNRSEAARRLGIHRQLLHAKAEKYGLGKRKGAND
jgi:DNA-binding NtrC family response regulator